MKPLFLIIAFLLALAGLFTYLSYPDVRTDRKVLYWVTDPNPIRARQVEGFDRWQISQGMVNESGEPGIELRTDSGNWGMTKTMIQGISGVGADVLELRSGFELRYIHAMGFLTDLSESAAGMGFDLSQTYASIEPEITVAGRQFSFPCNVYVSLYWVNRQMLEMHGQPLPPRRWTLEQFERMGKAFVEAANPPGQRQTYFYAADVDLQMTYRSLGLSMFNETMTRCTLNDERFVRCLQLIHKWTFEDQIIPSQADRMAFDTRSGYGGARLQLLNRGNYAMVRFSRQALIQLRKFSAERVARGEPPMQWAISEPPHGGFPNTLISTRAAGLYAGSGEPALAKRFLAYLASEDYNMLVVRDADALPPNPKYAQHPEFLRPADYPNEWGLHEIFAESAQNIGIGGVYSPFVLERTAQRIMSDAVEGFMNGLISAEEAARQAAERTNLEIQRTISETPALKPSYDTLLKRQEEIDRLKEAGELIPLDLIDNPFHRRYYVSKGWAE